MYGAARTVSDARKAREKIRHAKVAHSPKIHNHPHYVRRVSRLRDFAPVSPKKARLMDHPRCDTPSTRLAKPSSRSDETARKRRFLRLVATLFPRQATIINKKRSNFHVSRSTFPDDVRATSIAVSIAKVARPIVSD